jgi:3-hydroxyisobutyrate dehydrogenase-like beta-hydroxyacid dehydrogenase
MKIAFLGLGNMGSEMAQRLLAGLHTGDSLAVWNRTASAAELLVAQGAQLAATPAEAVRDAEAVFTMLFDDAANESVILGPGGFLEAMKPGTLHIACSTISVSLSDRLAEDHSRRDIAFVAAPVFGRPNVAADGKLWIVLAGAGTAVAKARPLLNSLSRGVSVVGERPSQAHAVKLAGNFLITMMIQSLSEVIVFAEASGLEPAAVLETVNSALFQSPFYAAYGKVMLNPPETPGATVELGVKDLSLFLDAARAGGSRLTVAELMAERFQEAIAEGLGKADWAAGLLKAAQLASKGPS